MPPLPTWITDADVPGYVVAHRLVQGEPRLFGTESLYGSWGGSVLLLAKDFGPTRIVRDRIAAGDPRPYRHEPGMRANRQLQRLAQPVEGMGLLYGSALGNLLRDDGWVSGALPNRAAALAYGVEVIRFVLEHMPARRWVVCLGREAWKVATAALGVEGDRQAHREAAEPLGQLVAAFHPSARVTREALVGPWEALLRRAA